MLNKELQITVNDAAKLKKEMQVYWAKRVEQFALLRAQELNSYKQALWLKELKALLPQRRRLKILDIGCGTGFFALLLAKEGHSLTAIDLTAEMLAVAEEQAAQAHLAINFLQMDAEQLDLPSATFDLIVTRNLSWALPNLAAAYKEWQRVLVKGGILLNFDADYTHEQQENTLKELAAHPGLSSELKSTYSKLQAYLATCQQLRPFWDQVLLKEAGFSEITVDKAVWQRLYAEQDVFYNAADGFLIKAVV